MPRKTNDMKLENIYNKVQEHPGRKGGVYRPSIGT